MSMSAINPSQIEKKPDRRMITVPADSVKKNYKYRKLVGDKAVPMSKGDYITWLSESGFPSDELDRTTVGQWTVQTTFSRKYRADKVEHPFSVSLYNMQAFKEDIHEVIEDRAIRAMPIQVGCRTRDQARAMHNHLTTLAENGL